MRGMIWVEDSYQKRGNTICMLLSLLFMIWGFLFGLDSGIETV